MSAARANNPEQEVVIRNPGDARSYLAALTREENPTVTFQTFSDHKPNPAPAGWRDPLARVLHGTLTQRGAELARLNHAGAGIFVMVNAGDLKGRAAENVKAVRAVFIDKDKPLLRPCALPPTFAVFTSPEKGHAYWLIKGELPVERFRAVQKRLIAFYGSDPGVHELCRVMRLPGFLHRKKEPGTLVTFEAGSGVSYTEDEILAAHPPLPGPRPMQLLPRVASGRSASAEDDEIVLDLARDVAARRPWGEGDRHASAIAVATFMRKIGCADSDIRSVVEDRLVAAGKTPDEAERVITWASAEIAPMPGERERVVEIERRRREREELQRKATR